jgi:DNA-binding NtrC family response regulator
MQRAVIYCRNGQLLAAQLPPHIVLCEAGPVNDPSVRLPTRGVSRDTSLETQVALTEKDLIEEALLRNNFSRTNTARDLGISRVTLYNKMKRYEILK